MMQKRPSHIFRSGFVVAAILLPGSGTTFVAADTLQQQIQHHVPDVISYLQKRGVRTVGVLKFRVQKPGQKTSDSVGTLNSLTADRLEVALILGNPFDKAKQLQIIRDASSQVTRINGANHLNDQGRAAFFGPEYRLAWGNDSLTADAFLTGVIQVHEGNETATVGILCFHRSGGGLERACDVFEADLDTPALTEMGESFVLRGAFDSGQTKKDVGRNSPGSTEVKPRESLPTPAHQTASTDRKVIEATRKVKSQQSQFPLHDANAPVRLEISYDGKTVPIQSRDGQAFVAEPRAGQKVEFAIIRTSHAKGQLGVVLRVNGENTLYRQTTRDLDCSKWILSDAHRRTVIGGYQMKDSNSAEQFTVLSNRDSLSRAVDYGRSVGQIQMTVFREEDFLNAADLPPAIPDEQEEDLVAILRGVQPTKTPDNLSALKHQVRTAGKDGSLTRGLIVQGKAKVNSVRTVTFVPDPTPVMSVTITYYKPAP